MKKSELTLSAPSQSQLSSLVPATLRIFLNRENKIVREATGFTLSNALIIRIIVFSCLASAALLLHVNSPAWNILCAIESVQAIWPVLPTIFNQLK